MKRHHRFPTAFLAFIFLAAVTRGDDLPRGDADGAGQERVTAWFVHGGSLMAERVEITVA